MKKYRKVVSKTLIKLLESLVAISLIILLSPLFLILIITLKVSTGGPILHWSHRVGMNNQVFLMPKFCSMIVGTPNVATHLIGEPERYITRFGKFLRKTSFDELPQLWSIVKGDMKFVGPRPALYNQHDLIQMRSAVGVDRIKPGITGLAQVRGRDALDLRKKVKYDRFYAKKTCLRLDLLIIIKTLSQSINGKNIKH